MRLYIVWFGLCLLGATVTSRQPLVLQPTHKWDYQVSASAASQRGGSAPTFTRAAAASRITSNSTLTTISTDVVGISLRLTGGNGDNGEVLAFDTSPSDFGFHSGEAVTYSLIRNTAIDNAAWADVGTPVVTANQIADIFGNTTVELIEDNSAAAAEGRSQSVAIPDDTSTWSASVWLTCVTPHDVALRLVIGANQTQVNGDCSGVWQKFAVETANPGGTTTAVVTLFPAGATVATVGETFMSYAQLTNETFQSLREVETGAAAVSTAVDVLTHTPVSPGDTGTLCAWIWVNSEADTAIRLFTWDSTDDMFMTYNAEGVAGQLGFDTVGAPTSDSKTATSTTLAVQTWGHVCWAWTNAAGALIYINGAQASYADDPDDFGASGVFGDVMQTGLVSTLQGEMLISRVKKWDGRLLNAGQINSLYKRELRHYQ